MKNLLIKPFACAFLLCLFLHGPLAAQNQDLVEAKRLFNGRQYERALESVNEMLPTLSEDLKIDALLLKADLLVRLRRREEAGSVLSQLSPRGAPARFFRVRGRWQLLQNRTKLARKDFKQSLRLNPEPAERLRTMGAQLFLEAQERDFKAGNRIWAEALALAESHKTDNWIWLELADSRYSYLKQAGRRYDALALCRFSRTYFAEREFTEGIISSWIGEAEILHLLNEMETAEKAAIKAIELSDDATALLFWGFSIVWEKHPPERHRTVIELGDKKWSEEWSEFEKFHLRLLQGLLSFYALSDYDSGLQRFQQAEELAGTKIRPSSGSSTILLAFHQFGDGYSSDMEKALWLQLSCLERLGRDRETVAKFMIEKLPKLPPNEKAPWLHNLGRRVMASSPAAATEYFEQALKLVPAKAKPLMLRAVAAAYRKIGYESNAIRLERELASLLIQFEPETLAELERFELYEVSHQQIREQAWSAWEERPFTPNPSVLLESLAETEEVRERLERRKQEKLDDAIRQGYEAGAESHYALRAVRLLNQGQLAEALTLTQQAKKLAGEGRYYLGSYRRLESLILTALGEYPRALAEVRLEKAALKKRGEDRLGDSYLRCLILESTTLLKLGRFEETLEITNSYLSEIGPAAEDLSYRATLEGVKVQALMGLGQLGQARTAANALLTDSPLPLNQMRIRLLLAEIAKRKGEKSEALSELRQVIEVARSVGSVYSARALKLWIELDPASAPIEEVAAELGRLLERYPAEVASRYQSYPEFGQIFVEKTPRGSSLTDKQFTRELKLLSNKDPQLELSLPLLPSAFVEQAASLAPGTYLVQYYTGRKESAIMMGSGEEFHLQSVGLGRAELEELVGQVNSTETSNAAEILGRILIEPVRQRTDCQSLILSTHGPLQSLPWDLLKLDGKLLPYHLSWQHWADSRSQPPSRGYAEAQILAIAGASSRKLPGTRREVEFLKRLGADRVTLLQDLSATRDRLRLEVEKKDIVHVATHSSKDGLELSDGFLLLSEIYSLPVKQGALVVLSSCQSGEMGSSERLPVSLATAFLDAGAGSVLATLDKVEDKEAEKLMARFYLQLEQGFEPHESLRRAKVESSQNSTNLDWSKFVLFSGAKN